MTPWSRCSASLERRTPFRQSVERTRGGPYLVPTGPRLQRATKRPMTCGIDVPLSWLALKGQQKTPKRREGKGLARNGGRMLAEQLTQRVVDWEDFEAAGELTRGVLRELDEDRAGIRDLILDRRDQGVAVVGSSGTSVVIGQWPDQGFELLLHLFQPLSEGRPHSHRRCFSTRILHGGYRHTWFGERAGGEQGPGSALVPYLTRSETVGSTYTLHRTAIHSINPSTDTVALTICEPGSRELAPGAGMQVFRRAVSDLERLRVI